VSDPFYILYHELCYIPKDLFKMPLRTTVGCLDTLADIIVIIKDIYKAQVRKSQRN